MESEWIRDASWEALGACDTAESSSPIQVGRGHGGLRLINPRIFRNFLREILTEEGARLGGLVWVSDPFPSDTPATGDVFPLSCSCRGRHRRASGGDCAV